eukprot:Tbor_TRINITY_DN5500_c6_g2::TRINITY_DN5500_c6_g2_i1::g.12838::m.12838
MKKVAMIGKRCWLVKTEPSVFSLSDFEKEGITRWDGVRNYEARNHIKSMSMGDLLLVYHSNSKPPGVVGLATVEREWYPDPTALDPESEYFDSTCSKENNKWAAMDALYNKPLSRLVTLEEMRQCKELSEMALIKRGRLSVQPVTDAEYNKVLAMSEEGIASNGESNFAKKDSKAQKAPRKKRRIEN